MGWFRTGGSEVVLRFLGSGHAGVVSVEQLYGVIPRVPGAWFQDVSKLVPRDYPEVVSGCFICGSWVVQRLVPGLNPGVSRCGWVLMVSGVVRDGSKLVARVYAGVHGSRVVLDVIPGRSKVGSVVVSMVIP